LGTNILVHFSLAGNLNTKVSKMLCEWILLLSPFCFCDKKYLHFTTRMFGHSAIGPFLGGDYKKIEEAGRYDDLHLEQADRYDG